MDKPMLKTGDPCPCCGQPIKTNDPAILSLLTYIQATGVNQEASRSFCLYMGRANGKTISFEMEAGECTTPT